MTNGLKVILIAQLISPFQNFNQKNREIDSVTKCFIIVSDLKFKLENWKKTETGRSFETLFVFDSRLVVNKLKTERVLL